MRSFKGTINIYIEYLQSSILSTILHIFLTFVSLQPSSFDNVVSFIVFQNTNHLEKNFLSKQLYFQSSIDYIEMRAAA